MAMRNSWKIEEYIAETNRQLDAKEDIDGYGCARAWIELPTGEVAEITLQEDGNYSALIHDPNGNPMLPYLTANNPNKLFAGIKEIFYNK